MREPSSGRLRAITVTVLLLLGMLVAAPAQAASSGEVAEAQRIMTKFAIPTGPVDGIWGAQTAQGMCTFRQVAGLSASRARITAADLSALRAFNSTYGSLGAIPAPARDGRTTYLLANETCQTLLYVQGGRYVRAMRMSTGKAGYGTPNGSYFLGATRPGWSCSTLYPESCYRHRQGVNARTAKSGVLYSTYGNMYNKRVIRGAYMLHGSTSVPTYPASHGCLRVRVADSDWLYRNVSNSSGGVYLTITGAY